MVRLGGILACASLASVAGHAYLAEPPARNVVANREQREYCPHCLQAGGPAKVAERGGGVWPTREAPVSHGLCGDPVQNVEAPANWHDETYLVPTPVQRTYAPGEIVEFQVGVSTHHRGHYEFRICDMALDGQTLDSRDAGQACLNKWTLQRAPLKASCDGANDLDPDCQPIDERHPERWYLPPSGEGWASGEALAGTAEVHRMRYRIPADLTCSQCTLQWYYSTGNTCLYDGDYFTYFARMQELGWPSTEWCSFCTPGASCSRTCCGPESGRYGEEFWNCADIAVQAGGGQQPPVAPSPASSPSPTPATQAPSPATQAPATPAPPAGGCSALWIQCGGSTWTGATCCQAGSHCSRQSEYYSQCLLGDEAPPATTPQPTDTPSTQAPTTEAPPAGGCAQLCGRQNLTQSGGCDQGSSDEAACREGYIVKGDVAVPCAWRSCGCFADGEQLQECPALDTLCTALLQHRALRGRHAAGRHASLSPGGASGMMFIEAAQTLSRLEKMHAEL